MGTSKIPEHHLVVPEVGRDQSGTWTERQSLLCGGCVCSAGPA